MGHSRRHTPVVLVTHEERSLEPENLKSAWATGQDLISRKTTTAKVIEERKGLVCFFKNNKTHY